MTQEAMIEKWPGEVAIVRIGDTISVGGEKTLPFLFKEASLPHKPVVAYEIWDVFPREWPEELLSIYGNCLKDPIAWAKKCAKEYKAQLLCLRLYAAHPDQGNIKIEQEAKLACDIIKETNLPLIILGCGDDAVDNQMLPLCSEKTKSKRCLLGCVTQDNYKTLTAAALADGHNIIAESPIDINIAKQLNILISDMGLSLDRIVINPTTGSLGYGLEYAYSIMERARLAGLSGDKTVASPFICFVGQETWKTKEAKIKDQGVAWEVITATSLLQAGANILVMRHPESIAKVKSYIDAMYGGN
ncbi:MAG: acetyl-CoA decarbonylase/synthase complex subunit delta [Candidatus Omnitrophica bacterium]|jgi:acetyl-CoA decarbonylase/synthase complex subunit delta|nr:acetyl-CoA decarbonylase/synthase complex subunit delta [Candidatus Omnitrophota bacterium]